MAKKKRNQEQETRELTRKEQRVRARDRERNRKLFLGVGITLAIVAAILIIGLVAEFVVKPNSAVAQVGDESIITKDFQKRARFQESQLLSQYLRLQELEQQFGGQGIFTSQLNQLQATLTSPFALGADVLDQMIEEIVIADAAAERGIEVTEAEIDEALREEVAAGQGAVTEPQATATAVAVADATATAASWTPTPTATPDESSVITETVELPTPEPLPTQPILDDAGYQEGLVTLGENLADVANMNVDEYRAIVAARLLREKMQEAIAAEEVTTTEEQVRARHILLRTIEPAPEAEGDAAGDPTPEPTELPEGAPTPTPTPEPRDSEETRALAEELRQRIEDGEDFAEIAAEYSDDLSNAADGGDLGWFGRGMMVAPFEEAAFDLEVGEISEPVETDFGWHLIEVLEKDDARPKDEGTIQQESALAFEEWIQAQIADRNVERPNNLTSVIPGDVGENFLTQPVAPILPTPLN